MAIDNKNRIYLNIDKSVEMETKIERKIKNSMVAKITQCLSKPVDTPSSFLFFIL